MAVSNVKTQAKVKIKGRASKKKTNTNKSSKFYEKKYRGQGR